jgi:hypothetical protein
LHDLLSQLIPGGAKPELTAATAKTMLATVRPRDQVGKARKLVAIEYLAELTALNVRTKALKKRITDASSGENNRHRLNRGGNRRERLSIVWRPAYAVKHSVGAPDTEVAT